METNINNYTSVWIEPIRSRNMMGHPVVIKSKLLKAHGQEAAVIITKLTLADNNFHVFNQQGVRLKKMLKNGKRLYEDSYSLKVSTFGQVFLGVSRALTANPEMYEPTMLNKSNDPPHWRGAGWYDQRGYYQPEVSKSPTKCRLVKTHTDYLELYD